MDEYIRKQDATDAVPEELMVDFMDEFGAGFNSCRNEMLRTIEALQPADVAEVVRCRSCSHFDSDSHFCFLIKGYMRYDDFCSYGKRGG